MSGRLHSDLLVDFGARGEPLGVGPALDDFLGLRVAGLGLLGHVVEEVEHQQGLLQAFGRDTCDFGIVEQLDQRVHVVAADHGAEQLGGLGLADQADLDVTVRDGSQEAGLDLGGIVDARRHAVRQQIHQEGFLARRRVLDQLDDVGDLLGVERQRRDAEGGALGDMLAIGLQHGVALQKNGARVSTLFYILYKTCQGPARQSRRWMQPWILPQARSDARCAWARPTCSEGRPMGEPPVIDRARREAFRDSAARVRSRICRSGRAGASPGAARQPPGRLLRTAMQKHAAGTAGSSALRGAAPHR
jgi:hypothetical protein